MVDEFLARIFVRPRRTEQNTVGNDARTASARVEHPQKERDKEQLGLRGLDLCRETASDILPVERAFERRGCEDKRVFVRVRVVL